MRGAETKTKLMEAAEQQIRQKGADGFSYADLSVAVGIRKASIHHHFPAKSDLLTAVMNRYSKLFLAALAAAEDDTDAPDLQLLTFISLYRQALQGGHCLCLCVAFAVGRDALSAETRLEITRFRSAVLNWLEQRFKIRLPQAELNEYCPDPTADAVALLALVEGAQLAARISTDIAYFDAATLAMRNRLSPNAA